MKVSTIIPLLNGEKYLQAAIDSVLSQTHDIWELIIVDGGSTDNSLAIVQGFIAQDERIRLISKPGSTIYEAIFLGISETSGEIVSWLNADDLYVPWAYQTAVLWMKRPDVEWITGLPSIWDSEGCLRCVYPHNYKSRRMIKYGFFQPGFLGSIQAESAFFSRELFQKLSKTQIESVLSLKLAGDFALWRAFAGQAKLHLVPSILGGFRIQGSNASIENFEAYINEVKSTKAICLPRLLAHLSRKIFNYSSVLLMRDRPAAENKRLNASLGLK